MITDVIRALEIAEEHLEKGEWVTINHDKPTHPVWVHVGTVHKLGNGEFWRECYHISYMIKDGVSIKHVGI